MYFLLVGGSSLKWGLFSIQATSSLPRQLLLCCSYHFTTSLYSAAQSYNSAAPNILLHLKDYSAPCILLHLSTLLLTLYYSPPQIDYSAPIKHLTTYLYSAAQSYKSAAQSYYSAAQILPFQLLHSSIVFCSYMMRSFFSTVTMYFLFYKEIDRVYCCY